MIFCLLYNNNQFLVFEIFQNILDFFNLYIIVLLILRV